MTKVFVRAALPRWLVVAAFAALATACASAPQRELARADSTPAAQPVPPVARQVPHVVESPAGDRDDPYYWLRDDTRQDPAVIAHLQAENAYTDAMLAPLADVEKTLFDEIVSRIKQDDASVPHEDDGWWYYTRFEEGKEYPIHARRRGSMQAPEQVMLDVNAMAQGKDYFQVGAWEISPDTRLIAWAEDDVGRRQYVLKVKNLDTGEMYVDGVAGISPNLMWDDDNASVYYVENDPVTLLTRRVKRHVLGTAPSADTLVYEEPDDSFYMGVGRTRSEQYLCIFVQSTVSTEQRCAPADDRDAYRIIALRERDHEYHADHLGDRWVIRSNADAPNFQLSEAANDAVYDRAQWRVLVPHDDDVFIQDFTLFDDFIAINERSDALQRIRVLPASGDAFFVDADEPAYTMGSSINAEPDTDWLRYTYTSLTTPNTVYEVNVDTGERRLLKRDPVLGDFDPADYVTERLWAPARDGERIPVSIVYRKGFVRGGTAPLYQYAYGSYGSSANPTFQSPRLSLLDRGVVFAVAHIRGGQDLGRRWYDAGKLLEKKNTFTDFIDVTDFLVREGYAAPDRVAAMGGSAGGLLMGAVANMAPEKYAVIAAHVPFVDVVTTMLDESIPLTTNEFDEWGNPKQKVYYDYMLSYSPYDNVVAQDYPAMYVSTGLWDSQVQYFEPAKWVARLRERKTDANPLLFRVTMEAGHGGRSGRFQRYAEVAEEYAFVMDRLGVD